MKRVCNRSCFKPTGSRTHADSLTPQKPPSNSPRNRKCPSPAPGALCWLPLDPTLLLLLRCIQTAKPTFALCPSCGFAPSAVAEVTGAGCAAPSREGEAPHSRGGGRHRPESLVNAPQERSRSSSAHRQHLVSQDPEGSPRIPRLREQWGLFPNQQQLSPRNTPVPRQPCAALLQSSLRRLQPTDNLIFCALRHCRAKRNKENSHFPRGFSPAFFPSSRFAYAGRGSGSTGCYTAMLTGRHPFPRPKQSHFTCHPCPKTDLRNADTRYCCLALTFPETLH